MKTVWVVAFVGILGIASLSGADKKSKTASAPKAEQLAPVPAKNTVVLDIKQQPWQIRRDEYIKAYIALGNDPKDTKALETIDRILTEYEKVMWSRTPIEAMDILQTYYIPAEGIKTMSLVVTQAILGYRDVLQWATPSAKAEIINNEQFLTRALRAGKDKALADEWIELIQSNPNEAKAIIDKGIQFALTIDSMKTQSDFYDRHWPSGYGLERTMAALGQQSASKDVTKPKMGDDEAMEEAIRKISEYYLPQRLLPQNGENQKN